MKDSGRGKKERLYNEQMVEACECDGCCWEKVAENIMDRPVFLMEARPFFLCLKHILELYNDTVTILVLIMDDTVVPMVGYGLYG